jgi:hypothetical protein
MADPSVQVILRAVQINCPSVEPSSPRQNSHAQFWYNFHVRFVADGRCMETHLEALFARVQ